MPKLCLKNTTQDASWASWPAVLYPVTIHVIPTWAHYAAIATTRVVCIRREQYLVSGILGSEACTSHEDVLDRVRSVCNFVPNTNCLAWMCRAGVAVSNCPRLGDCEATADPLCSSNARRPDNGLRSCVATEQSEPPLHVLVSETWM
jgi:hypothetical protein